MQGSSAPESFRGLLLRHRGRTRLMQRELAVRAGVSRRSVQEWEAGDKFPTVERLQTLIRALLEADGFTPGQEASEAHALWTAALREASRMHTPFDAEWFAGLHAPLAAPRDQSRRTEPQAQGRRVQDWGEAPDTIGFVGRVEELALLRGFVVDDRCRVLALLGMGGIGKTMLAARLAQQLAPRFERAFWRSMRNAPPVAEWLAGAIGFLSDQQVVPPASESERLTALVHLLRASRCLLVLDNVEALFEPGQRDGQYRRDSVATDRSCRASAKLRTRVACC